jgi:hypothetical protein
VQLAQGLITAAEVYAAIGGAVAAVFLVFGIDRIDPAARGTHTFRPLLIPGIVILWPLVVVRWLQLERQPHNGSH